MRTFNLIIYNVCYILKVTMSTTRVFQLVRIFISPLHKCLTVYLTYLFVVNDLKVHGMVKGERTLLQIAALHLFCVLSELLWDGLSHEDKLLLLQLPSRCLLRQCNRQVFFFCSILRPVDKAVPIRRTTRAHTNTQVIDTFVLSPCIYSRANMCSRKPATTCFLCSGDKGEVPELSLPGCFIFTPRC